MSSLEISTAPTKDQWKHVEQHAQFCNANQLWEWGEVCAAVCNLQPVRLLALQGGKPVGMLQALQWSRAGICLGVVSGTSGSGGGPVVIKDAKRDVAKALLEHLQSWSKEQKALRFLTFSSVNDEPVELDAKRAQKHTPIVELATSADDLLAELSSNARHKILKAQKSGIKVHTGEKADLQDYFQLQQELIARRKLPTKHTNSLQDLEILWDILHPADRLRLYVAKKDDQLLGALLITQSHSVIDFRGGVSTDEGRSLYVNNLLHWHAIEQGIAEQKQYYNMEGGTKDENDPLYGITKFKLSMGGELQPFYRYSATGNRYLNAVIEKARTLVGYKFWFPQPMYP